MSKSREIPSVTVNNYASIFTKPIFQNQNGEWYRDVGYVDSLDIIRENFVGVRKSFVAIGYYLKHIKEKKLYEEGGYQNIWECAQEEFGLSQPAATNYMKMNDAYSMNGDTPILDEKYTGFNKSQLQEMLALPEEKRDEIKPDQTVTEIRNIAKEEKRLKEPSEKEIRQFYDSHIKDMDNQPRSTLKERLKKEYRTAGGSYPFSWRGSARGICLNKTDEITWSYLVKLIDQYIPKDVEKDSDQETDQKEEQQLAGQMNLEDYPEVLPEKTDHKEKMDTKEKNPNLKTDCPPGISQCIRQEWGFTPEQQRIGSVECTKCWDHWKKQQGQGCKREAETELKEDKETEAEEPGISDQQEPVVMKQEENRILILYELLERAEREKDGDAAAALRWAIFTLEKSLV